MPTYANNLIDFHWLSPYNHLINQLVGGTGTVDPAVHHQQRKSSARFPHGNRCWTVPPLKSRRCLEEINDSSQEREELINHQMIIANSAGKNTIVLWVVGSGLDNQ